MSKQSLCSLVVKVEGEDVVRDTVEEQVEGEEEEKEKKRRRRGGRNYQGFM